MSSVRAALRSPWFGARTWNVQPPKLDCKADLGQDPVTRLSLPGIRVFIYSSYSISLLIGVSGSLSKNAPHGGCGLGRGQPQNKAGRAIAWVFPLTDSWRQPITFGFGSGLAGVAGAAIKRCWQKVFGRMVPTSGYGSNIVSLSSIR